MTHFTRVQLILIAAGGSAALVIGAFIFQALGYPPCKLCWWQRYPHFAAVALAVPALALGGRVWAWLGALAAAATSAIGFYHSGVERKLWEGPDTCTSTGPEGLSAQDLLNQIMEAPLVRCDEIPWRLSDMIPWEVLDITMANLNFLGSAVLAVVWVMAARKQA
jgi:disulfide bond formation protein DsbB